MSRIEKALEKALLMREPQERPLSQVPVPTASKLMDRLLEVEPLPIKNPYVATAHPQQNIPANEEFRKLRSQVLRLTHGETFRNCLLITSTAHGEGKTVTSLNLAIALAQEYDYTVLLVDADLRKPTVHQLLDIHPEVGLIQCLRGEATLEESLIKTGLGKLVVLPAGGTVDDPVELLSSSRMKEIVRELKARYPERYVLFDTPPILPFADAQVLESAVDGVLFVVREGWADRDHIQEALESLNEETLLGVVYNDASNFNQQGRYAYY